MFNRRFLRVKVLQGLYAYYQNGSGDLTKSLRELDHSVERGYDLYLYLLSFPIELKRQVFLLLENGEERSSKIMSDLKRSEKFMNNELIAQLESANDLQSLLKKRGIGWGEHQEMAARFVRKMRASELYQQYLDSKSGSFKEDQQLVIYLFKEIVPQFELLSHDFLEKSIYWDEENFDYAVFLVLNTLKKSGAHKKKEKFPLPLYDNKEDKEFVRLLFRKTIEEDGMLEESIMKKTTNWDSDRIAMMDMILMKMALAEILNFNMIPVKVSMNEYIDISKSFSSPKSGQFINGVLDKVVLEFKEKKAYKKVGRGLKE